MTPFARYASPYNAMAEAGRIDRTAARVEIHDLTLEGDGEEMAGVWITEADKVDIARRLADIGVPRLSVLGNSPRPTATDIRIAEKIVACDLPVLLGAFVKTREEIDIAANIGLAGVTMLVGANDALLPPGEDGDTILDKARTLTGHARKRGLHTCFMAMDATRSRPEFLRALLAAVEPDCDEITIADSLGVASPFGFRHLIELVATWTALPVQVHCHNHSSMAVANALAAVAGGARVVHTTVNGVGELAGQVPLEEFVVAAGLHLDLDTGIETPALKALSDRVVAATGVPVAPQKPATGARAFCIPETEEIQQVYWELSQRGQMEEGLTYSPSLVGNRLYMSIGRRCNEFTVRYHLAENGLTADDAVIDAIAGAVREASARQQGYYLMDEGAFITLVREGGFAVRPADAPRSGTA
ncbi:MAG: hypothetical protein RID91_04015 [Azospirillaceae bacterium]